MVEGQGEQLRLFVACELPDDVRTALGRVQDDLRRLGAGRLRWVRPEGIHVTLKFLGAVETDACGSQEKTANRRRSSWPPPTA